MKVYVDQSGKVEDTNKPTIVAFSNSCQKSLLIASKDKKRLMLLYRKVGKPKLFRVKMFSILVYLLIKSYVKAGDIIIIDREYMGYEDIIKSWILEYLRNDKIFLSKQALYFEEIGKKNEAHNLAISTFRKKHKSDIKVGYKDVLRVEL